MRGQTPRQNAGYNGPMEIQTTQKFNDDLTLIPMRHIIHDVRACIDANISVAGLALALTIPDVLGQKMYPGMVYRDGDRKVHAQYARWFDAYVASDFGGKDCWFDGDMCYELRCSILHSGKADIAYRHERRGGVDCDFEFALVDDGRQFHKEGPHPTKKGARLCQVHINADLLAGALADGAERCLQQ